MCSFRSAKHDNKYLRGCFGNINIEFQVAARRQMEGWTVTLVVLMLAALNTPAQTSHIKVMVHVCIRKLREMWARINSEVVHESLTLVNIV